MASTASVTAAGGLGPKRPLDSTRSRISSGVKPVNMGGAMSSLICSRVRPGRLEMSIVPPSTNTMPLTASGWVTARLQRHIGAPGVAHDYGTLPSHYRNESRRIAQHCGEVVTLIHLRRLAVPPLVQSGDAKIGGQRRSHQSPRYGRWKPTRAAKAPAACRHPNPR